MMWLVPDLTLLIYPPASHQSAIGLESVPVYGRVRASGLRATGAAVAVAVETGPPRHATSHARRAPRHAHRARTVPGRVHVRHAPREAPAARPRRGELRGVRRPAATSSVVNGYPWTFTQNTRFMLISVDFHAKTHVLRGFWCKKTCFTWILAQKPG